MEFAFTKAQRILTKKEFERVFSQSRQLGVKIEMPSFFVLTILNDTSQPRIGFALSKKHLLKAHLRNRIKRIFREEFRLHAATIKNVDMVVLAKPGLARISNQELRRSLTTLWRRINDAYP